jgi:phosphomannomutase
MTRLAELTGVDLQDMLLIGDRLDPEGNDYPVKVLGGPTHAVGGSKDTARVMETFLTSWSEVRTAV